MAAPIQTVRGQRVRSTTAGSNAALGEVKAENCLIPWYEIIGVLSREEIVCREVTGRKAEQGLTENMQCRIAIADLQPAHIRPIPVLLRHDVRNI